MRNFEWLIAVVALMFAGCAAPQAASETRKALAPTGELRVGFVLSANQANRDTATGQLKGIAIDLGGEAAKRLGVGFAPVPYTSFAGLWAGAKSSEWDLATMGITAERAQSVDFTQPYMVVEYAFLAPAGSSFSSPADYEKAGVRIAVLQGSSPDHYISGALRQAVVVRCATVEELVAAVQSGKADALFGTRGGMLNQVPKLPGSRVLERAFGGEETAIAIPKGRPLAAAYARKFVEEAKSEGLVKAAIEKSGTRNPCRAIRGGSPIAYRTGAATAGMG